LNQNIKIEMAMPVATNGTIKRYNDTPAAWSEASSSFWVKRDVRKMAEMKSASGEVSRMISGM